MKAAFRFCSTILLCELHFGQHFATTKSHQPQQLAFKLDPIDHSNLQTELKSRILTLKKLKNKVRSDFKTLMMILENLQSKLITEINESIKKYQEIFETEEFNDIEEPKKILEFEMIIEEVSPEILISKIGELYSKSLLNFDPDLDKRKTLMKNKFLQTHNGGFNCVAISTDGKLIVTGSEDTTVRVWDFYERKQIACYVHHTSDVNCVTISNDSTFAVSGSADRSLILWDLNRHTLRHLFQGHTGNIKSVSLSLDENLIVSGSYSNELCVWSMKTFQLIQLIKTTSPVWSLLFTQNDEIVSATGNNIELWNINSFNQCQSIVAHNSEINSLATTKNNKLLITGSNDKTLKLFEYPSLKTLATLAGHTGAVLSVTVTPDDSQIISSSEDNKIFIFSLQSFSKTHELTHHDAFIFGVRCFEDFIVSVSRDARIGITKLSSKSFQAYIALKPFTVRSEQQIGNFLAYGSLKTVSVWDVNGSETVLKGHSSLVKAVCFTSDAERLVSASQGPHMNLMVWNLKQGRALSYLNGHSNSVFCVDVSFDDKNVISGDFKGRVLYWDLVSMKQVCEFKGHTGQVLSVKFTRNKKFAASGGSDKKVLLWDVESQALFCVLSGHESYVLKVSLTFDDEFVVSGSFNDGIRVWSVQEKR